MLVCQKPQVFDFVGHPAPNTQYSKQFKVIPLEHATSSQLFKIPASCIMSPAAGGENGPNIATVQELPYWCRGSWIICEAFCLISFVESSQEFFLASPLLSLFPM